MALRLAGEGYAEGGVTEFLGLSDTPGSYAGEGGKYAKVHAAENALEFDTPSGGGDMLKSVYDTDDDGIVDNSEKLEGSTKAQVQNHDPKAHTHTESEITDLEHDAVKLQGRDLDSGAPADGQVVTWEQTTSKWKPKTPAGGGDMLKSVYDTDDDGIVDNSEKLEGATKAQVQDHDPKAHAASHQDGGADEISVAGLSGELADLQKPKDHTHQSSGGGTGGKLDHGLALDGLGDDDHTQYLNTSRHDTTERHPLGTVVPHDALANLTERAHSSLTGIGASDHHEKTVDASELTTGNLPAARLGGVLTTQGDILIRDAAGPTRLGAGTSGQFLKTQGAGANPVWADVDGGGSFDFFDKFREILCWVSKDGFTSTIDTGGSISADGHNIYLKTGNVSGNKAYLYAKCDIYRLVETGKVTTVEWLLYSFTISVANQTTYLHQCQNTNAPPTETDNHFGFKIVNGDLYASNGDDTTQKITDTGVNISSGSQHTVLRAVVTQGTNVKFYVDGVLKVTHTDNLPAAGQYRLNMGFTTNEAANKYMRLGRIAYERDR
ncbi:hypothetical protein ES703_07027 [subsurface metagenome]